MLCHYPTSTFNPASLLPSHVSAGLRPLGYRLQRGYSVLIPVTVETLSRLLQIADAVLQQGARPTVVPSEDRYGYSKISARQ